MKDNYDRTQEPIVISKPLLDLLLKQKCPPDLIALYCFYYYTAKWQKTNQPKATNTYVAKGLHWSSVKVGKIAKQLENLGLIKRIIHWDEETKKIAGHYIKIKFIWTKQGLKKAMLLESNNIGFGISNALRSNKLNALSSNNKSILQKKDKFSPIILPPKLSKKSSIRKAWKRYVLHRTESRHKITERAYNLLINKMLDHSSSEIVDALNRSVENNWTGLFFNDFNPIAKKQSRVFTNLESAVKEPILVKSWKQYHDDLEKRTKGKAVVHLPWSKFYEDWIEFLKEKQEGFPVRGLYDLEVGRVRWNEFIRKCEVWTGWDFTTGRIQD